MSFDVVLLASTPEASQSLRGLLAQHDIAAHGIDSLTAALEFLSGHCQQTSRVAAIILALDSSAAHSETLAAVGALSAHECALPILVIAPADEVLDRALSEAGASAFLPQQNLNATILERALRYATARSAGQRELRAQVGHQNAIAATTPLVMVTIDEDNIIQYVNPAVQKTFGYAPEEVIGQTITSFLTPADVALHLEDMERYGAADERPAHWDAIERHAIARDGSVVPIEVTFNAYLMQGRRYFAATLRDVSEQKQAREALRASEARYAHIAANAPGMIYQMVIHPDLSSEFAFASEGIRRIFGVAPEAAYTDARALYEQVHPDDKEEFFRRGRESFEQVKPMVWIGRIVRSDGKIRWAEVRSHPTLQPNGDLIYDGLMLDVTARLNAEIELNQAHLELEDRVVQRTQQLAHANATLHAQIEVRKQNETEIRRHARQQETLSQLSQSALGDIELPVFLRGAVALAAAATNAQFGHISQLDASGQFWLMPYFVGWPVETGQQASPVIAISALRQVLESGLPLMIGDWSSETRWQLPQHLLEQGVRSTIYVRIPGLSGGDDAVPHGVLAIHSELPHHFSLDDVQFLQAMANIIATTLQRRQLNAELLETSQRLHAVMDNATAVIFIKDLTGRYVLANRELEAFHDRYFPGAPPLLGHCDADFMRATDAARTEASDRRVCEEKRHHINEISIEYANGVKYFLTSKFPLFDAEGAVSGIGGVATDITDRKEAELAREDARREAEVARIEADRANRAKSEFLSRMSHELRTPLNAIIGFTQLLESSELPPRSQQGVQQILRAGRHLLNLINEVLDMSSIEAGHLSINLQTTIARPIIEEVIDLLSPLTEENQVRLYHKCDGDCDTPIRADPQRLLQILLNLVSNAIKYNRRGGQVVLSCRRTGDLYDARLQITVRDTGRGIAPDKMARLWQPFDRLDAENNSSEGAAIEGTGLGLTLSRALAQSMNGTLEVTSTLDQGSTFYIELPAAAAPRIP